MTTCRSSNVTVVMQHIEDAIQLRNSRSLLIRAPHVELDRMSRTDERLAGHLDGILVAGAVGQAIAKTQLDPPGCGSVFTATILALESQDYREFSSLLAVAETSPKNQAGFQSAIGWVSRSKLGGVVRDWVSSPSNSQKAMAIAACGFHGINVDKELDHYLESDNKLLVDSALRTAGVLGRTDLLEKVAARLDSNANYAAETNISANMCAVILGNRASALASLKGHARAREGRSETCFQITLLASPVDSAYAWLREWASVAKEPWVRRRLIRGCGLSGDVRYIPWLIEQMNDLTVSRLAGESFSFITGAHLALLDLERKPPENAPSGPNDDPADENVAMDEDEGLPWPDVARVHAWWTANAARFPAGHRYLVGAPASEAQCLKVLRSGGQRQRAVAAVTRCLLRPGTPLFQVAAPAWRQQRWLTELGA